MIVFLYELLYVLAVSLGAAALLAPAVGLSGFVWAAALTVTLLAGALTGFKNAAWTIRMILAGGAVTVASALFLLNRNEAIREIFAEHAVLLWLPVIAAGAFAAGELFAHVRIARLIAVALSALSLILSAVWRISVDKLFVAAVLYLLLLALTEEVQRTWKKSGSTEGRAHLVYVAPFLLAAMLLVAVSPAPDDPYDWAFVQRIMARADAAMRELHIRLSIGNSRDPSETMMGFSGRGRFFAGLRDNDEEIMELSGLTPGIRYLKLAGKTFDTFDGREWTDTDASALPDVTLDTLSLLASVDDYTGQPADLVRKATVQIRFRKINTAYVFAPLKTLATGSWAAAARLKESGGDLLWPGVRSLHTQYTVPFFRLNTDHSIFAEYLRTSELPSYENYAANAIRLAPKGEAGYAYEDLLRHRDHIREVYGQPVELSDAIRDWLKEATADALTPCDRMKRLEGLLRNLTYSVEPGELPDEVKSDADFLDYFLRESREGYCSHFATAFVLLARAQGLPARYVQGYLVPVGGETGAIVRSSMAHAWPEVYYDGAGWIAYEPTPIYEVTSYWQIGEETGAAAAAAEPRGIGHVEPEEEAIPLPEPEEEDSDRILIPWYVVAIPFAAGILVALLLIAALRLIGRIRFRRLGERERFVALCRRDLYLLKLLELGIRETETLREYGARIREKAGAENTRFLSFLEKQLYEGRYDLAEGERAASETEKRLSERLRKEHPLRSIRARMQMGW